MASPTKTTQNNWQSNNGEDFLQLRSGAGLILSGIDSTGTGYGNLAGGGSGGSVLTAVVQISSAQLKNLIAAPVTLIPAPGAGIFINAIAAYLQYDFVTTPYVVDSTTFLGIGWAGMDTISFSSFAEAGTFDQSVSISNGFGVLVNAAYPSSQIVGQALLVGVTGTPAVDMSGGDGTATAIITYTLVTV